MASLSLTNQEIYRNIAMVMGINRDSSEWSATTLADVQRIIRAGRRKFQDSYDWSFLRELYAINVKAPYTTGTIAVADGVVTLTGGTWASDAENQKLAVGGNVYHVASRDSDTQLTLANNTLDVTAGTSYSLYTTRYALPSNFSRFLQPPTVEGAEEIELIETAVLPEFEIRRLQSLATAYAERPRMFSVTQELDTNAEYGIPTYWLDLYPLPNAAYVVRCLIGKNVGDALAADESTEIFHSSFSGLLQSAILSCAEKMWNNEEGVHTKDFNEMLPAYIRKDERARGAQRLLPRGDSYGRVKNYELLVAPINIQS